MLIEQIEITGTGFSMLIDVEAEYVDVPTGRDIGETGSSGQLVERDLTGIEYPSFELKTFIKSNKDYEAQVLKQIWAHLDRFGD